mmetsp:Transcript_13691/g.32434  ORF Transcript_13691/g.32434 Transcript_13691/m.32434 type:complete len:281 (+) Transcript_13691:170-1012(+)
MLLGLLANGSMDGGRGEKQEGLLRSCLPCIEAKASAATCAGTSWPNGLPCMPISPPEDQRALTAGLEALMRSHAARAATVRLKRGHVARLRGAGGAHRRGLDVLSLDLYLPVEVRDEALVELPVQQDGDPAVLRVILPWGQLVWIETAVHHGDEGVVRLRLVNPLRGQWPLHAALQDLAQLVLVGRHLLRRCSRVLLVPQQAALRGPVKNVPIVGKHSCPALVLVHKVKEPVLELLAGHAHVLVCRLVQSLLSYVVIHLEREKLRVPSLHIPETSRRNVG